MDLNAVVIGGGVAGLAVLGELSEAGLDCALLERHPAWGRETSSRNSEVIHGGMYYAPGSLKAACCVEGRRLLYEFLASSGVRHKRCGKIIVAVDPLEEESLEAIRLTGRENGVEGLEYLSREALRRREPDVTAVAALFSPETGIVDAHGLMDALARRAVAAGATIVCGAAVEGLERSGSGSEWTVRYRDSGGTGEVSAKYVVNCAGLGAQEVMRMAGIDPDAAGLALYPCKGCYFAVQGEARRRIRGLVYPAPEKNLVGLGVHTIIDLGGGVKMGPDTEYVPRAPEYDYAVPPERREAFLAAARRYLPFLRPDDLAPGMAGMRPKLSGPGQPARDFYIAEETARGYPGFINLAGIESPGLTACLSLARRARGLME